MRPSVSVGGSKALREERRVEMDKTGNSGLSLFVFEGNGGNSSTNLESVANRIMNRMVLRLNHTLPALNSTIS